MRDVFYIHANFDENHFIFYGMEFWEFIRYCPNMPNNILITDGSSDVSKLNESWWLETVSGRQSILELSKEDIYALGNFNWIDYNNETDLNECTPEERAEVLYLSHFGKPVKTSFMDRIDNHFVYLGHDDGWFCKLYCKDMSIFKEIIANKIIGSINNKKRREIYPINEEIKTQLFELTTKGLLIDFSISYTKDVAIGINCYAIGKFLDMDEMYDERKLHMQNAGAKLHLEYCNNTWRAKIL